ncbi:MAG: serine/threonine-protein kinase, partial [Planctomycetota bacterium]
METPSLESMRRIDRVCEEYERAGFTGAEAIERALASLQSSDHSALISELIPLDIELRFGQGQTPKVSDYESWLTRTDSAVDESDVQCLIDELAAASSPSQEPDKDSPPNSERYEYLTRVGRGGAGDVWRVFDTRANRTVAIKHLRNSHFAHSRSKARLLREALLTGRLQHPGIPPIYDFGETEDGATFFSMKLVEGVTFENILRSRTEDSRDLNRMLKIFEQVTQTVAYAHSNGIIHRDLKPQNVMVGAFGEVQVMDWGMAKALEDQDEATTSANESDQIRRDAFCEDQ